MTEENTNTTTTTTTGATETEEVMTANTFADMTLKEKQTMALFNVFEQGARACANWGVSQFRIQCLNSIQTVDEVSDIPAQYSKEILSVLNGLLEQGQLTFEAQSLLLPSVEKLYANVPAEAASADDIDVAAAVNQVPVGTPQAVGADA